MKKHLLKLSVALVFGGVVFFAGIQTTASHTAGGTSISGCSGSKYDEANLTGDCSSCHAAVQGRVNWIRTNIPNTGYIPGTTYTITCVSQCKTSGHNSSFGFEFTPQNQSTGKVIGTLANITTSGKGSTTIASSEWITHTGTSYTGTDSCVWSFKWTAPTPGVGAVPFYAAFNCGSGTSQSSGWIYLDSTHVPQASTVGIPTVGDESIAEVTIFPNPIKDRFSVSYSLQSSKQVEVNMYSIDGRKVANLLSSAEQVAGDHTEQLTIPTVTPGIYLIQIIQGEQSICKKVLVQ